MSDARRGRAAYEVGPAVAPASTSVALVESEVRLSEDWMMMAEAGQGDAIMQLKAALSEKVTPSRPPLDPLYAPSRPHLDPLWTPSGPPGAGAEAD